jgi:hypothetical protein
VRNPVEFRSILFRFCRLELTPWQIDSVVGVRSMEGQLLDTIP